MQQQSGIPTMLGIPKNLRKCNAEPRDGHLTTIVDTVVSSMLEQLEWDTLKIRCTTRLQTLFTMIIPLANIPHHYLPQIRHTRQYHPLHFIIPNSATAHAAYQQSFYSRTIKEWNHLPPEIVEQDNLNVFTDELLHYYKLNHCS